MPIGKAGGISAQPNFASRQSRVRTHTQQEIIPRVLARYGGREVSDRDGRVRTTIVREEQGGPLNIKIDLDNWGDVSFSCLCSYPLGERRFREDEGVQKWGNRSNQGMKWYVPSFDTLR